MSRTSSKSINQRLIKGTEMNTPRYCLRSVQTRPLGFISSEDILCSMLCQYLRSENSVPTTANV